MAACGQTLFCYVCVRLRATQPLIEVCRACPYMRFWVSILFVVMICCPFSFGSCPSQYGLCSVKFLHRKQRTLVSQLYMGLAHAIIRARETCAFFLHFPFLYRVHLPLSCPIISDTPHSMHPDRSKLAAPSM